MFAANKTRLLKECFLKLITSIFDCYGAYHDHVWL